MVILKKSGFSVVKRERALKRRLNFADLRDIIEVEEGVTVRDLFRAVDAQPKIKRFIAEYSFCKPWIDLYHEEAYGPAQTQAQTTELDNLLVQFYVEFMDSVVCKKTTVPAHMNEYVDVCGVGSDEKGDKISYSISFMSMTSLRDLPIVVKPTVTVRRFLSETKDVEMTDWEHHMTLLDFLDAIYYEISFHGSPTNRDSFFSGLKEMAENIKKGEANTTPFEFCDTIEEV